MLCKLRATALQPREFETDHERDTSTYTQASLDESPSYPLSSDEGDISTVRLSYIYIYKYYGELNNVDSVVHSLSYHHFFQ